MKNKKMILKKLEVVSFTTTLSSNETKTVNGGQKLIGFAQLGESYVWCSYTGPTATV